MRAHRSRSFHHPAILLPTWLLRALKWRLHLQAGLPSLAATAMRGPLHLRPVTSVASHLKPQRHGRRGTAAQVQLLQRQPTSPQAVLQVVQAPIQCLHTVRLLYSVELLSPGLKPFWVFRQEVLLAALHHLVLTFGQAGSSIQATKGLCLCKLA